MKFGLATAYVGPLLPLVKMDNMGFILEGLSSIGKTTILKLAASTYGDPMINVHTWRTTDNAMENYAYLHNHTFLAIDELSQVKPELLEAIVYMLGNGEGKARADQGGESREVKKWREGILCTGEIGINDKLEECGKKIRGGQDVRMSGLLLPDDHINNLHSFDNQKDFVDFINRGCSENYGCAGRDFIEKLVNHENLTKLTRRLLSSIDKITAELCQADTDGQISRVAKKMALVGCAGKLAALFGTLPQTFTKMGYIRTCFNNWLANRKLDARCQEENIVMHIRNTLESNRTKHFQDIRTPEDFDGELWGYRGVSQSGCQETDYVMTSETFKRLFCKGNNLNQIARLLKQHGMLRFDMDADGPERNTKKVTFGEFKQKRLMVLNLGGK